VLNASIESARVSHALEPHARPTVAPAAVTIGQVSSKCAEAGLPQVPAYLSDIYDWAYLNPRNVGFLDREAVVACILWGNHNRLRRSAFEEIRPGQQVLQPACIYGDFSAALARHIGPQGRLQVLDIAPIQVERCRRKLRDLPHANVRLADAAQPSGELYDVVCCYFLLHEIPLDYKRKVIDALLGSVKAGGKVIFIDYHKPKYAHPLKPITSLIFDTLEPFAKDLWGNPIAELASIGDGFEWGKRTYFGGLFQKVIATKPVR
jgi:ubiquinone/menaquinone biosynthesis C-methylase UbiE